MARENIDVVVREEGAKVVKRNLEEIGTAAQKSGGAVEFLKSTLQFLGIAEAIRETIKLVNEYQDLQNRLRAVGLEGNNLKAVFDALVKVADQSQTSISATVEGYASLQESQKQLGASQTDLIELTGLLNKVLILSGSNASNAAGQFQQFAESLTTGQLEGRGMLQLLKQLPLVADIIAQHFGVTRSELQDMAQKGKISAHQVLQAFQEARVEIEERFAKAIPTVGNAFTVLKNKTVELAGKLDAATGLSQKLSGFLLAIANNLEAIFKVLLGLAAPLLLVTLLTEGFSLLAFAVTSFLQVLITNPLGLFLVVLAEVVSLLVVFRNQIEIGLGDGTTLGDLMTAIWRNIAGAIGEATQAASDLWAMLGPGAATAGSEMSESIHLAATRMKGDLEEFYAGTGSGFAGILKAAARTFDAIIGFIIGLSLFVKRAMGQLVSEITNIFKTLENTQQSVVETIANTYIKAANVLREAVHLDPIDQVKFERAKLEGPAKFKDLGALWAEAMNDGFSSVAGTPGSPGLFEGAVDSLLSQASDIAKARKVQALPKGRNASPLKPDTVFDPEAAKVRAQLIKDLQTLIGTYDQVYAAQQKIRDADKLLTQGVAAGLIPLEKKVEVMNLIKRELRDQLAPIAALNRELDKQIVLLNEGKDAREIDAQVQTIAQELLQQGIDLLDTSNQKRVEELALIREKLKVVQEETKLSQAKDQIEEAINGPLRNASENILALQQLVADGTITQGQANAYFVSQQSALLEGTIEARAADLNNLQQYYIQVEQWRQADLISEQTKNQLLARADLEYSLKRLDGARSFFGTLSGLQRSENRKLAAIGKAAAVAQATIDGYAAVQAALKGPPGPPWSYAIAAAAAAVAGVNVASIINTPLPGFAFGGSLKVAGTGGTDSQTVAFRATPGENVRISTPSQDREDARRAADSGGGLRGLRLVNVVGPELLTDWAESPEGEQVLVNVMVKNQEVLHKVPGR